MCKTQRELMAYRWRVVQNLKIIKIIGLKMRIYKLIGNFFS